MIFRIDDRVLYRVDDNTLTSTSDPEQKIALTLTSSRLLLLLLSHQGEVMPRETIYRHVWEDYGLEASGNTLTQYVSVLRRALHTLGVGSEAIITVPRIGFMVSAELDVTCLPDEPGILLSEAHEMTGVSDATPEGPAHRQSNRYWYSGVLICLMVLAILILLYLNVLQMKVDTYTTSFVPVGTFRDCRVYTLPMYEHDRTRPSMQVTEAIIRASGLLCAPGGDLYVHIDGNVAHKEKGKIWVSACTSNPEGVVLRCRNYISNDWRMRE